MRWTGKVAQKHVLNMLLASHRATTAEAKTVMLAGSLEAGMPRMWWYRILKSYCPDYKDGAIVGYDEPLCDQGLQGFDEEKWGFFKKADTEYLGRAAARYSDVKALTYQ